MIQEFIQSNKEEEVLKELLKSSKIQEGDIRDYYSEISYLT
jgi:predicted solute-binding protein